MTVHDFNRSLAFSHDQADAPWWDTVYRRAFPDLATVVDLRHDGWHQRAGRDRAVMLSSGQTIYVDEKVRSETYEDILIEVWSVYPKNGVVPYRTVAGAVPGWARKPMGCDWLAYAFVPARTCYLFPFLGVRAALEKHSAIWIQKATDREIGFRWVVADNKRYNTISIAVPIWILTEAINQAMTITWQDAA